MIGGKMVGTTLAPMITDIKRVSQVFQRFKSTDMLEQPCLESSINFAAEAFGREALHLQLSTTSACRVKAKTIPLVSKLIVHES